MNAAVRPRRALLWTSGVSAALGIVLTAAVAYGWQPLMSTDRALSNGLHAGATSGPTLTHVSRVLSDWVWDPITMRLAAALVVAYLLRAGAASLAGWVAAVSVLAWVVQFTVKTAVGRDRPEFADPVASASYFAFPSGHTMAATTTCGVVLVVLHRTAPGGRWPAIAWGAALVSVVGVGLTRIHLGVHWPSDVLGGWLLGIALVTLAAALAPAAAGRARSPRPRT